MIKYSNTQIVNSVSPQGYLPVRESMDTNIYGLPMSEEMALVYELQLQRVEELMRYYEAKSTPAIRAVEAFISKAADFAAPSPFTTPEDRAKAELVAATMHSIMNTKGIPSPRLTEMANSLSDFPTLLLGCIQRKFISLASQAFVQDNCFDPIFQDVGVVPYCRHNEKNIGLVPVLTGHDDSCAGEGPLCSCVKTYKFE